MESIRSPSQLATRIGEARHAGQRIGFVPTMGFLHEGHMSLLRLAKSRCDLLVMSLFVNPTQFKPGEDLATYPRDEAGDFSKAESCGVDIVFTPSEEAMYPPGFQTQISLPKLFAPLCGVSRPSHFSGVATIVTKLFHLVAPDVAVFGQKDAQQLAIIRQLVRDLNMKIEIIGAPIVREEDGLAMSSRNVNLGPDARKQARCLSRGLFGAKERFESGVVQSATLIAAARAVIAASPLAKIDYIEIRDAQTLEELTVIDRPALMATAVRFGQTRLIDNVVLTPLVE